MNFDLNKTESIIATGRTGSLGSQLPEAVQSLKTRLEAPLSEKIAELRAMVEAISPGKRAVFIHCAALTSVPECEAHPEKAQHLNVRSSAEWFEACETAGVSRFIFISTSHVYQVPKEETPLEITSPVQPRSVYAKSKWEAEETLKKLAETSPVKLSIARVFSLTSNAIRPGFLQHSMRQRALAKDYSPIPGFHLVRDFIDAKEVGEILIKLATSETFPPLINICSGKPKTVGQLSKEIFEKLGVNPDKLTAAPPRPTDIPYLVGVPSVFE